MGVGYMELRQTPDHVIGMDLEFLSLDAKYSQPEISNNEEAK